MWRSFFLAIGIFLFAAGVQCLAFEQFFIDNNNRVLSLVQKASGAPTPPLGQNAFDQHAAQPSPASSQRAFSLPSSYYGGPSRFESANYANSPQANLPSATIPTGSQGKLKSLVSHPINDWVPWCLLAVGTIVCLYTKSLGSGRYAGE
jgi:hypothetical protein